MMEESIMEETAALQDDLEDQEFLDLFLSRASMYGLLAELYRGEISLDIINELKKMRFPKNSGNESVDKGFKDIYEYLKTAWDGSDDELGVDYTRTFIGSGVSGYSAAYLYESVYTSERRLLGREARGEVLQYFRNNNLVKGKWNDMEDHLSLELEFMQIMSIRTHDALSESREDDAINMIRCQRDFVHSHLNNWLPMMVGDALKFSETQFYQGVALLTLGYCESDEALLDELLEGIPEVVDVNVA